MPFKLVRRALVGSLVWAAAACGDRGDGDVAALGQPVAIETPAPMGSNTPSLVTRPDGTTLLSWTERRADSSIAIRVAGFRAAQWDTTRTIGEGRPFFVNWADFPSVTVLGNGALAAHWLEREGTSKYAYGIRVVRSNDSGRTWSAPVTPHTDGLPAEHGFVTLWPDGVDGLGVAWLDGRKSAMPDSVKETTVRTAVVAADGSLQREALLDARSCDCCQVVSAATRSGHVVVYRNRSAEEIRDIVAVRTQGTGWSEPVTVHADNWHYPGCPVNGPSVVARGDTVVVAWFTAANDTARVLVARSVDGGATFGPPTRVDDGDPLGRVAVVFDRAGDAVVAWMERRTPETSDVRVRRIAGGQRSASQTVTTTSAARQSGFPRLAVVADTLMVAWTAVAPSLQVRMAQLQLFSHTPR
ncbi:MAG: exo-alpha-sialidase [Gemmatimonadaceae bacterium]|nr:exo-alpha-sialidase [Gemmatimonadaceae bacterium]